MRLETHVPPTHNRSFLSPVMSRAARPPARKGAAEPESRPLRLWELLFRPRLMLGVLLIAGGIAIAPFLPVWWDQLRNQEEYRITPSDIVVTPPNEWVPPQLLQEVLAEFPPRMSLLDDSLLTDIAVAFARNPWIESVEQVRKTREGIEVDLVYRRPVLFVKTELGFYPVDAAGILLLPPTFPKRTPRSCLSSRARGRPPRGGRVTFGATRRCWRLSRWPSVWFPKEMHPSTGNDSSWYRSMPPPDRRTQLPKNHSCCEPAEAPRSSGEDRRGKSSRHWNRRPNKSLPDWCSTASSTETFSRHRVRITSTSDISSTSPANRLSSRIAKVSHQVADLARRDV